jgi:hypothetical protein
MAQAEKKYLTPREIVDKYPEIPFSIDNIGRLVRMRLVKGFFRGKIVEISVDSLNDLIQYRNDVIQSEIVNIKR